MQPYFLPYLGYFALIRATDRFILFDTVPYNRAGWLSRNRVLHPKEGWQYVGVPLKKHAHMAPISEFVTARSEWRFRLLRQLEHYRRTAPYYDAVIQLLTRVLDLSIDGLAVLNEHLLRAVA